jgi:hypothetical protein
MTTAPVFEPGTAYDVDRAQCVGSCVADGSGRLHLAMALGQPPTQQYLFGAAAPAITTHVRVTITRA